MRSVAMGRFERSAREILGADAADSELPTTLGDKRLVLRQLCRQRERQPTQLQF